MRHINLDRMNVPVQVDEKKRSLNKTNHCTNKIVFTILILFNIWTRTKPYADCQGD